MSRSNRLLDTDATAHLLGCSPAALTKFRTQRRGPPYVRVGRLIRYRRVDLTRWLKSRRVLPEAKVNTSQPSARDHANR
jgi:predicted DNA-binding transcriptional regulator AlpA